MTLCAEIIAPSVASVLITFLYLSWISRKELRGECQRDPNSVSLSEGGKFALAALLLAAAALIASSALGLALGAPTCGAAIFAMAVVTFRDRTITLRVVKGVSWSVLPLVAGLFVIVEALQYAGLLRLGLAGLHALAALWHRFFLHDGVLARMWPKRAESTAVRRRA